MGTCIGSNHSYEAKQPARRASSSQKIHEAEPKKPFRSGTRLSAKEKARESNKCLTKENEEADDKSTKSRTTSASSNSNQSSEAGNVRRPKPKDELDIIRADEGWFCNNLHTKDVKDNGFVVDSAWMDAWRAFINKKGNRPWKDINKEMFVEDPNGQLVFLSHKRNYLISRKLWTNIRKRYGSGYALEVHRQSISKAYKISAGGDIQTGNYEEIELAEEDSEANSEEEYLPTEKDSVLPIRPEAGFAKRFRRLSDNRLVPPMLCANGPSQKRLSHHLKAGSCVPPAQTDDYAMESVDSIIDEKDHECLAPALGLRNYGENCYVNAGLQCLLCVPEMNAYFLQKRYKSITYPTKKRGFAICEALTTLYGSVFDPSGPDWVAPKGLLTLLPSGQQDTHELFWRKLFPLIQDETNPKDKKARKEDLDGKESWNWYRTQHYSILDAMFAGQLESQVICKVCGYVSTAFDPFFDLSVTLSGDKIETCLEGFFEDEELGKKVGYHCDKCKKVCPAVKKTKIDRCPRYLIIHLKRLVGTRHKISDYIEYGPQLDLSPYCAEKAEYKLAAVCIHNGTAQGGHNYAVGKRGDQWYLFNDKSVKKVTEKSALNYEAYILLYARF